MKEETQKFFRRFYLINEITYEIALESALVAAEEILKETSDPNKWNELIKDLKNA